MKTKIKIKKSKKNNIWFKRKLYGFGWYPITWQGWLTTFLFILINFLNALIFNQRILLKNNTTFIDCFIFYFILTLSSILLIIICFKKGEKPKWSWGK
ncbi:MAG: hypothetical protein QW757_05535 [Candidatus Woesearchaeota archaeon]